MRKFPKAFTRRKSTANAFEDLENITPVEGSFKVFDRSERADTGSKSFDGGIKLGKPTSASGRPAQSPAVEDNMFENIGNHRASGGSSSNPASLTTTDKSSRLSAASTTASSTDVPARNEEWKSPHDKPFSNIPMPPPPKSTPKFSLKDAGRSLSWGRNKPSPPTTPKEGSKLKELPSLPPQSPEQPSSRPRTITASSYASTATPPKIEEKELGLSLGGDFSQMFAGFGKRKSVVMTPDRVMSQSPEILPPQPNRFNSPAHLTIDNKTRIEEPPYSWGTQGSHDGLMANRSPPLPSTSPLHAPPPVPQHAQNRTNADLRMVNPQARPGATSTDGLRRSSALAGRRQSTLEYRETVDEDARLLRDSVSASRRLQSSSPNTRIRDSWALPSNKSQSRDQSSTPSWRAESTESTPKANQLYDPPRGSDDNMFDNHIAAAADLAARFEETSITQSEPPKQVEPVKKVMTPAQFERYRQDQERMRSYGIKPKEEEDDDVDNYDDEEDEAEKAKQAAKQRRQQEAHMAVYRQQMMKVTGEVPGGRPGMPMSQSTPNLLETSKDDGDDEDEEIPLAILQAHGFPNKNRPPRNVGSNPNLRSSMMPAGGGEGGRLPVFARGLPQDPYYGAGLQRPMHRESMAFGGGAQSVSGAPPRGAPPGGLVGVIATEERSRAIRRGSPNAQGDYGPQIPNMGGSMYGGMPGDMGPMGMNPMMMTPGDHAQAQMAGQMQQLMQMQMHIMNMMSQGQGAPSIQGAPPMMPIQGDTSRPNSAHLRPGLGQPNHQRAMTMMEPNAAPWMQQGAPSIRIQGYTPSIAPSERSNVGMPGRYRPVSHMPMANDNKSRLSTMSGALPNWETAKPAMTSTIRPVQQQKGGEDEDDEGGWEEMARKKKERKSTWKSKRNTENFENILNFN